MEGRSLGSGLKDTILYYVTVLPVAPLSTTVMRKLIGCM